MEARFISRLPSWSSILVPSHIPVRATSRLRLRRDEPPATFRRRPRRDIIPDRIQVLTDRIREDLDPAVLGSNLTETRRV